MLGHPFRVYEVQLNTFTFGHSPVTALLVLLLVTVLQLFLNSFFVAPWLARSPSDTVQPVSSLDFLDRRARFMRLQCTPDTSPLSTWSR